MVTFLLILGGLIAFNFILLKFSVQSVDTNRKKSKNLKSTSEANIGKTKATRIAKAA
ncbi:hypothetical protein GCM10009430_20960 [Aquimarina litoralis]|uniref:Uncharacterized protein n=1 Tax=Aquimarina litoralis TaxID=584605 RepID=A0ABN1ISX7_9FLAO